MHRAFGLSLFEMVFHLNGNLCGSWLEDEDILLPYECSGSQLSYSTRGL